MEISTSSSSAPVPSISSAVSNVQEPLASPTPSTSSDTSLQEQTIRPQRPGMGSRKTSGSMIIPRDSQRVEMNEGEEEYDQDDVRCMSPKRSPEDIQRLGEEARQHLIEQAKQLQASLLAIVDRVETVKEEHDKLEGGNKFLQQYIGELIQTTKITSSSAASKTKGKSSGRK